MGGDTGDDQRETGLQWDDYQSAHLMVAGVYR